MDEKAKLRKQVREALAEYMAGEGCGCCADDTQQDDAAKTLAKLLNVPAYSDGSGYDFAKYRSK